VRALAAFLSLALLPACYEIKPKLPKDYIGSPAAPGWPPPAVYAADPFHPANRLFHRLWGLGGESPFPRLEKPSAVDRAEILALLGALREGEEGLASVASPAARAVMQSDLLAAAAKLSAAGAADREVLGELARAALALSGDAPADSKTLPPPLREAGWTETTGAGDPALRPSASDLRWTRTFERGDGSVVLRLRIGARASGEPVLLDVGSEAWHIRLGDDGPEAPRAFALRRARLLGGEDPWEELPAGPGREGRAIAPGPAQSREAQLDDARKALGAFLREK